MKVTEPIDVYLADKLFQLTSSDVPAPATEDEYRAALTGKTMVVFGGSYGIGADIADARPRPRRRRVHVQPVQHQHPRRAPRGHRGGGPPGDRGAPAGSTTSSTRPGSCRAASCSRPARRRSTPRPRSTTWRRSSSPRCSSPTCRRDQGSLTLFTSSSYTRGRSGYSLYSSAKAATVNLTQALADEWAADRVRVNCINPERTGTPMRTKAFGAGAGRLAARVRDRGPDLARRDDLDADRAHHRRPQGRPVRHRPGRPGLIAWSAAATSAPPSRAMAQRRSRATTRRPAIFSRSRAPVSSTS